MFNYNMFVPFLPRPETVHGSVNEHTLLLGDWVT